MKKIPWLKIDHDLSETAFMVSFFLPENIVAQKEQVTNQVQEFDGQPRHIRIRHDIQEAVEWRGETAQRVQRDFAQRAKFQTDAPLLKFGNKMPNFGSPAFPEIQVVNPPRRTGRNLGPIRCFPPSSHPTLLPIRVAFVSLFGLAAAWGTDVGESREVFGGRECRRQFLGLGHVSVDGWSGLGGKFNCTESRDSVSRFHHTRHSQGSSIAITLPLPLLPTASTAAATTRRRSKSS